MSYFQWLAIFWGIPLAALFVLSPKILVNHRGIFAKILVGVAFVGLPSDIIAVGLGLWGFPQGLSGIYLLSLPVEEFLWAGMYAVIVVFLTLLLLERGVK